MKTKAPLQTLFPPTTATRTPALARRAFLKTLGSAALAAPFVVRGGDKACCGPVIVGSGDHRYEVLHDWGRLPARCVLGNTHGVVVDSQGHVIVKHTVGKGSPCGDAVLVFDADGTFVRSWGSEFQGGAHGLHLAREGREEFLYLCDTHRRLVVKTTLDGRAIWRADASAFGDVYADPNGFCPTNVATAPDGTVFVADGYGSNFIHKFSSAGDYRGTFGGTGKGPGQLACPHGLMVDTRGTEPRLVVADRGNRRLQYFSLDGVHQGFVEKELRAPCHFAEKDGTLLIPDLESRVTLFDRENKLVAHLGDGGHYNGIRDKAREAFKVGAFVAPHSACFDHAGNIFVVEWVEVGRITKLRRLA